MPRGALVQHSASLAPHPRKPPAGPNSRPTGRLSVFPSRGAGHSLRRCRAAPRRRAPIGTGTAATARASTAEPALPGGGCSAPAGIVLPRLPGGGCGTRGPNPAPGRPPAPESRLPGHSPSGEQVEQRAVLRHGPAATARPRSGPAPPQEEAPGRRQRQREGRAGRCEGSGSSVQSPGDHSQSSSGPATQGSSIKNKRTTIPNLQTDPQT